MDLDYITAYQHQVTQYLELHQALGYVIEEASDELVIGAGRPGTRQIELADFGRSSAPFETSLDDKFFALMIDPETGNFMTPESAYNSDAFQALVSVVLKPLTDVKGSGDFSLASVTQALEDSVLTQYAAMGLPGSANQPTTNALPRILSAYLTDHVQNLDHIDGDLPPIPDWREGGPVAGETPYDTYRVNNYIDVPFTLLAVGGSHTVTRDISYVFEDGTAIDAANAAKPQRAAFECKIDQITGETQWLEPGEVTLPAVDAPAATHPAANATVLAADTVPELVVTRDSENSNVTVTYPLNFTVDVRFIDADGAEIADAQPQTGRWNTEFTASAPAVAGYTIDEAHASQTGRFTANAAPIVFTYQADSATDPGTPGPGDTEQPGTTPKPTPSPQPGDALANSGSAPLWGAGAGALALLAAGAALVIRRRKTHAN